MNTERKMEEALLAKLEANGLRFGLRVIVSARGDVHIDTHDPACMKLTSVVYVAFSARGQVFKVGKTKGTLFNRWRGTLKILQKPLSELKPSEIRTSETWLALLSGSIFEVWYKQVSSTNLDDEEETIDDVFEPIDGRILAMRHRRNVARLASNRI